MVLMKIKIKYHFKQLFYFLSFSKTVSCFEEHEYAFPKKSPNDLVSKESYSNYSACFL